MSKKVRKGTRTIGNGSKDAPLEKKRRATHSSNVADESRRKPRAPRDGKARCAAAPLDLYTRHIRLPSVWSEALVRPLRWYRPTGAALFFFRPPDVCDCKAQGDRDLPVCVCVRITSVLPPGPIKTKRLIGCHALLGCQTMRVLLYLSLGAPKLWTRPPPTPG